MQISEERRQALLLIAAFLYLIIFFSSFLLFSFALHIKLSIDSRMALLDSYNSNVLPVIFLVLGLVNLIHDVTAMYTLLKLRDPAQRESTLRMLMVVLWSGIFLVLFETSSAIVSFVHIGILDDEFKKGITRAMDEYVVGEELKREMDAVQMDYSCCGDRDYTDWFQHAWLASDLVRVVPGSLKKFTQDGDNYYADDVPFSCCDVRSPRPCIHHHIHDDTLHFFYNHIRETTLYVTGCRRVLMDTYGKILLTVGSVALAIATIKTCTMLLVRLQQTSMYKAEELGDWEATTVGYIYYEAVTEGEDGVKRKAKGATTTDEDTTSVGSGEENTSTASEEGDANANTTVEFESDYSTNASGVSATTTPTTSSSSSPSSSSSNSDNSSESESWEDLSTTDSDEVSSEVAGAEPPNTSRYSSGQRGIERSPIRYKVDNLKSNISMHSPIDDLHYQNYLDRTNSRKWPIGDDTDGSHGAHGLQKYPTQLTQRRNRRNHADIPSGASSSQRYPEELIKRDHFMSEGPLSQLRQRSTAYLDEETSSQANRTDHGLLSRIKEHLTGTSRGSQANGLAGLFPTGYKYSRLGECEPEWGDNKNTNINAGPINKMKTKTRKIASVNDKVGVSALHQTTDFIDETIASMPCHVPLDRQYSPSRSASRDQGGEQPSQDTCDTLSQSNGTNGTQTQEDSGLHFGINNMTNRKSDIREYSSSQDNYSDISLSENTEDVYSPCIAYLKQLNLNNTHNVMKGFQDHLGSSTSSVDEDTNSKMMLPQPAVPIPHRKVSFSETSTERGTSVRKASIMVRCATPYYDVSSHATPYYDVSSHATPYYDVSSHESEGFSEYDLIPTSIRPPQSVQTDQDKATVQPSKSTSLAEDVDTEVAEIISGSSTWTSLVNKEKPEVQDPSFHMNIQAASSNLAAVGKPGIGLHVGLSPAGGAMSTAWTVSSMEVFCRKVSSNAERSHLHAKTQLEHAIPAGSVGAANRFSRSPNAQVYPERVKQSPCKKSNSPKDRGNRTHIRSCKKRSLSNNVSPLTTEHTHHLSGSGGGGPNINFDLDAAGSVQHQSFGSGYSSVAMNIDLNSKEIENDTPGLPISVQAHGAADQITKLKQSGEILESCDTLIPSNSLASGRVLSGKDSCLTEKVGLNENLEVGSFPVQTEEKPSTGEDQQIESSPIERRLISPFY